VEQKPKDFSLIYFIVALAVMFIAQYLLVTKQVETISYSQFKALVKQHQVTDVVVRDKTISGSVTADGVKDIFPPEKIKELGKNRCRFWLFELTIRA
jgi:cell division protease FtsH